MLRAADATAFGLWLCYRLRAVVTACLVQSSGCACHSLWPAGCACHSLRAVALVQSSGCTCHSLRAVALVQSSGCICHSLRAVAAPATAFGLWLPQPSGCGFAEDCTKATARRGSRSVCSPKPQPEGREATARRLCHSHSPKAVAGTRRLWQPQPEGCGRCSPKTVPKPQLETFTHTYTHACIHKYILTYTHTHTYIPTYILSYLRTLHTLHTLHASHTLHTLHTHYITLHLIALHYLTLPYITLHTCMHACMHTYIHTNIHAYMHYIHT